MRILVIDGMGGGLGKAVIEQIKTDLPDSEITAVGTNSAATAAMIKGGADYSATGENAVVYNSKKVDIIVGAIGIVFGNSMHGEISPSIAEAVSMSEAHKLLIPMSKCNATVLGVEDKPLHHYITEISVMIKKLL